MCSVCAFWFVLESAQVNARLAVLQTVATLEMLRAQKADAAIAGLEYQLDAAILELGMQNTESQEAKTALASAASYRKQYPSSSPAGPAVNKILSGSGEAH